MGRGGGEAGLFKSMTGRLRLAGEAVRFKSMAGRAREAGWFRSMAGPRGGDREEARLGPGLEDFLDVCSMAFSTPDSMMFLNSADLSRSLLSRSPLDRGLLRLGRTGLSLCSVGGELVLDSEVVLLALADEESCSFAVVASTSDCRGTCSAVIIGPRSLLRLAFCSTITKICWRGHTSVFPWPVPPEISAFYKKLSLPESIIFLVQPSPSTRSSSGLGLLGSRPALAHSGGPCPPFGTPPTLAFGLGL